MHSDFTKINVKLYKPYEKNIQTRRLIIILHTFCMTLSVIDITKNSSIQSSNIKYLRSAQKAPGFCFNFFISNLKFHF